MYDDSDFYDDNGYSMALYDEERNAFPFGPGLMGAPYRPPVPKKPVRQITLRPRIFRPLPRWNATPQMIAAPTPEPEATVKLGPLLDAAAQILGALAALPASPAATGEAKTDMTNLITYQQALAQHAKRDEQIRTAGKLARLFVRS